MSGSLVFRLDGAAVLFIRSQLDFVFAFTPETGAARVLELKMASLFADGTMHVLKHHGMVAGAMRRAAAR